MGNKYNSYLNMGAAYGDDDNHFNALCAFETSISKEHCLLKGLNNTAVTFKHLGLQKQALTGLNHVISLFERNKRDINGGPPSSYVSRASLFRFLNKPDQMNADIEKSFSSKTDFISTWIEKGKYEIQNCNFEEGVNCFNKSISYDKSKSKALKNRAAYWQVVGEYKRAIEDFTTVYKLLRNPTWTLYDIGKAYYFNGDRGTAENYYNKFLQTGNWAERYDQLFEVGLVQYIDTQKGFGFIFGKSWFNDFDSIYFKLADCLTIPTLGERVRFTLRYGRHENQFKAIGTAVQSYDLVENLNFRKQIIYHCILHTRQNSFKAPMDFKYLKIFYPCSTMFPSSMIEDQLDEQTKSLAQRNGYALLEVTININEMNEPTFSLIKPILFPNIYSNKFVESYSRFQKDFNSATKRSCFTCGGDDWCGTDSCPLDPTIDSGVTINPIDRIG